MEVDAPADTVGGGHEDSQRATSDGCNNIAQPHGSGAIDPAVWADIDALIASGSSMLLSTYFNSETHTFLGDWQGQEAAYLAWLADAENSSQDFNVSKTASQSDSFLCASEDDQESLFKTTPLPPLNLLPELECGMTQEREREIWIHFAISPAYLKHDLLRCSQDLSPKASYELFDLPLLSAQYARSLTLQQVHRRWTRLAFTNWLREMCILKMAREDGLWPWAPLEA
jgi:hypothetical protein